MKGGSWLNLGLDMDMDMDLAVDESLNGKGRWALPDVPLGGLVDCSL